jgi:hypothetical protein
MCKRVYSLKGVHVQYITYPKTSAPALLSISCLLSSISCLLSSISCLLSISCLVVDLFYFYFYCSIQLSTVHFNHTAAALPRLLRPLLRPLFRHLLFIAGGKGTAKVGVIVAERLVGGRGHSILGCGCWLLVVVVGSGCW